jgi:16S rRNA (cytidine1402-2'-O)-methyltransferase
VFGGRRRACLARELTKLYEDSCMATLDEMRLWLAADANRRRGEFVLVVAGAAAEAPDAAQAERVLQLLLKELAPSAAARVAAEITGAPRKALYAAALRLAGGAADADENGDNGGL